MWPFRRRNHVLPVDTSVGIHEVATAKPGQLAGRVGTTHDLVWIAGHDRHPPGGSARARRPY